MDTIIEQTTKKIKSKLEEIFNIEGQKIDILEKEYSALLSDTFSQVAAAYYEKWDSALQKDKEARKQAGLVVERNNVKRDVLTSFGMLRYRRTYYHQVNEDAYVFPTDLNAGVDSYQRISTTVTNNLVSRAIDTSYEKATQYVTNKAISKQTVMNKIRNTYVPEVTFPQKRTVPYLHIDADEDHVHLQKGGKSTIVPLITVYEGIKKVNKRGICINAFSISQYDKNITDIWDKVLTEIENRYDISNTKIYIHGDGASWIKSGLEWIPNSEFVLDEFHKNKAIKQSTANMPLVDAKIYQKRIYDNLRTGDKNQLLEIKKEMSEKYPKCHAGIDKNIQYLYNNDDGIRIRQYDQEANNGGCTEPHVSHVLSARLSRTPSAWSEETLRSLSPILASKRFAVGKKNVSESKESKVIRTERAKKYVKNSLGLIDPDIAVSIAGSLSGHSTCGLFSALRPFMN